jgi:wyosine [tRNA(Phe)-imidazoG37] synthetase (radical SAM superfamily)
MPYVFGPVPSRRLGLSLGVDLIPHKTCSFDCLYCQVGRTTARSIVPEPYAPVGAVVEEIRQKLLKRRPDVITLAGSGEPTLHSQIGEVVNAVKDITDIPVVLLTNGSLFWKDEVRKRALKADIIMPTLTSALETTFRTVHRPHADLRLDRIVRGLKQLRREYAGRLFLEVVFLAGINDTDAEVAGLRELVADIDPDKVQINTVIRPPADAEALPLDRKRLEEIKVAFGEKAEIVADVPSKGQAGKAVRKAEDVLEMLTRRPLKQRDVEKTLGLSPEDAADLLKGLLIKGYIREQNHSGDIYYQPSGRK